MSWQTRHTTASAVAQVPLEQDGLITGDLILIQHPGRRHFSLKLREAGEELLRWDLLPPDRPRRHRNPKPSPPCFPRVDRALEHEHPPVDGVCGPYSRPLAGLGDVTELRQVFETFCDRANIDPHDAYTDPPDPQLALIP